MKTCSKIKSWKYIWLNPVNKIQNHYNPSLSHTPPFIAPPILTCSSSSHWKNPKFVSLSLFLILLHSSPAHLLTGSRCLAISLSRFSCFTLPLSHTPSSFLTGSPPRLLSLSRRLSLPRYIRSTPRLQGTSHILI